VGRENILKPTIGNESLHQDSSDNGVRLVNFATSKNLVVKSTIFPHRNIHKYTWTSPDGNTHNQIFLDYTAESSLVKINWNIFISKITSEEVKEVTLDLGVNGY